MFSTSPNHSTVPPDKDEFNMARRHGEGLLSHTAYWAVTLVSFQRHISNKEAYTKEKATNWMIDPYEIDVTHILFQKGDYPGLCIK